MTSTKTKTNELKQALSVARLEIEYAAILEQEKTIAERKETLKTAIFAEFDRTNKDTVGRFHLSIRKSLSWSLADLRRVLPTSWESFITPDDKLLRVKATSMTELLDCAAVKEVTALVFSK